MSTKHDVLFVVLDSARKDRFSAFGHHRETTEAFDRIASEATKYENAFVPAPWTLPSHCSMFTGKFPSEHGITNGFTDRNLVLSTEYPTITELLAGHGYLTAGFSNNPWVGKLSGLNRGFDYFVEWDLEISRTGAITPTQFTNEIYSSIHSIIGRAARQPHALLKRRFFTANLVERAKKWLVETNDRPSFTFMNLMEAHSPYFPPGTAFRELGLDPPGIIEPRILNARLLAYVMGKSELTSAQRNRVMEYYDASLKFQDGKLDELLSLLRSQGRYDDTLIVICADHGKTLGDYDRDILPPHYTRDININVPLVIKWPHQQQAEHITKPVELTDLFGAISDFGNSGELPVRENGALVEDYIPHTGRNASDVVRWQVLADESLKYVQNQKGEEFLFDRVPSETMIGDIPSEVSEYRDRLRDRQESLSTPIGPTSEAVSDGDVGKTVEGQLKDLGYLH